MQFGPLRKRITIEQNTPTQGTDGGMTDSWGTFADVWASIEPLNGRELMAALQVQSQVTTRVTIRYYDGITPSMRVNYQGRYFDIQSVINVNEVNRTMQLLCIERVGQD